MSLTSGELVNAIRGNTTRPLMHRKLQSQSGLTLMELIVSISIMSILALAVLPVARLSVRREKERELRSALSEIRDAIDRYKDGADRTLYHAALSAQGYPPDLETLVNGVDVNGKKVRFLRRIPIDPMTGKAEWGLRSMADEPDSESWGGQSVYDVYSQSPGTAINGTKYRDW